jgi:hypothetical protein
MLIGSAPRINRLTAEPVLFIYLFSFALTKNVHKTSTTIHILYMRHNKRRGHHNSLHQLLWALKYIGKYKIEKKIHRKYKIEKSQI